MINSLLLLAGNDIPFNQAQLIIHVPSINEISFLGEDIFFKGLEYLIFSKNILSQQDKNRLDSFSDFQILMTLIKSDTIAIKEIKISIQLVLSLLFPQYKVNFLPASIMLFKKNKDDKIQKHLIDKDNFEKFKEILRQIFCFDEITSSNKETSLKYNPGGPQAKALVQKFKLRHKKLASLKNKGKEDEEIRILFEYVSILSVGLEKDINQLLQYTIYQLLYEFRRFKAKRNFDIYLTLKAAGAQNLQDVQDWMNTIQSLQ